jgi:hypothetical protein
MSLSEHVHEWLVDVELYTRRHRRILRFLTYEKSNPHFKEVMGTEYELMWYK